MFVNPDWISDHAGMVRVLVLCGTGDAIELVAKLSEISDIEVIASLAGRTRQPASLTGTVRIGGFGGADGLTTYLQTQKIDYLIDATHPFAIQMSDHAVAATKAVGIPSVMLVRPAWEKVSGDRWIEVESVEAAVQAIPVTAKRIFLTIGRQQLAPFTTLKEPWFLIRSIESSDVVIPNSKILLDRGPFSLDRERQLLRDDRIDLIVSKNSGGEATYAKVVAARELDIPIVMVQRPVMPNVEQVESVDRAIDWLQDRLKGKFN